MYRRTRRRFCHFLMILSSMLGIGTICYFQSRDYAMQYSRHPKTLTHEQLRQFGIKENMDPRYIVYNRVPKCASMSMTTLSYKLGYHNHFKVSSPYEPGEKPSKSLTEQKNFIKELYAQEYPYLYIRHQYFINFEDFGEVQPTYINMIRDPISRFESFYYFSRFGNRGGGGAKRPMADDRRRESIDECIANRRHECTNPYWQVVPYFCGQDERCQARTQWSVDRAKENIVKHYLFVGVLEELDDSLNILSIILKSYFDGAVDLLHSESNENMRNQTLTLNKTKTSEQSKNFLKTQTSLALEYDLYNFVLERLHQLKRNLLL